MIIIEFGVYSVKEQPVFPGKVKAHILSLAFDGVITDQ